MIRATRFGFVILLVAAGLLFFTSTGRVSAQTTPTLYTVHVASESGQPIPGAEAMLVPIVDTMAGAGEWKKVQGETVTFTADDLPDKPKNADNPASEHHIIIRAPGYAPVIARTKPEPPAGPGINTSQELSLQMKKGRQILLEIVPPPGRELPADLEPIIIPEPYVSASWSGQDKDHKKKTVGVSFPVKQGNGRFLINVEDNFPPLYLMIDQPGFLQAWQPDTPIPTTGTAQQAVRFELPEPITLDVKFENAYAAEMPADVHPVLKVTGHHKMPKKSEWIVPVADYEADYENAPGVRTWTVKDLPSGEYNFSVTEGRVESRNSMGKDYDSGSITSVTLVSHAVIPQVVALDENGTTITDAEARISSGGRNGVSSHGWKEATNGVITFNYDSLTGRYSGDRPIAKFEVEARAPGYALTHGELQTGEPDVPPVAIKLDRGQKITFTISSEDGRPVPTGLKPIIMSEEDFPRAVNYLSRPESAPALAVANNIKGNQYECSIPSDIKSFRIGLEQDDFIQSFWSEPITGFTDRPIELKLPKTGGLQVDVTLTSPPLNGSNAEMNDKYYLTVSKSVKGGSTTYNINIEGSVIAESTTTLVSNLPPGDYEVEVRPYRSMQNTSKNITVTPGTTTTVALKVDPPDPNSDRFGRSTAKFPMLKITGEDGSPIKDAQAIVRKKSTRYIPTLKWKKADANGQVKPEMEALSESPDGAYEIIIRAPGYQAGQIEITLPDATPMVPVKLEKGSEVLLKLTAPTGQTIPENLSPAVFPENWGRDVWLTTQPSKENVYAPETLLSPLAVTHAGAGEFKLNIDAQSTVPLYVLINHPGFLRAFQVGPFAPADWASSGTTEVKLPKPATIASKFQLDGQQPDSPVITMQISRSQKVPGAGNWGLRQITEELPATSASLIATDLGPGDYSVKAYDAPEDRINYGDVYSTSLSADLDAGESETLTLVYRPFKKEWLQGPFTATIKVTDQAGKPAAGKPYKVTWYESGYGQQTVAEGAVPANGIITLENLAGVEKPMTREELKTRGGAPSFNVEVDSQRLGYISFYDYNDGKYTPPADGKMTKEFEFRVPPKEGDKAPDFAMHDLVTSKTIHLSDLKDQVVLIDFWATWCGPCQGPMAENQEIMRKHAADWKGKATILALSIDDELETVIKHLDKHDWHETYNAWAVPDPADPEKVGWKAPAASLYGINSIPTMVLIGKDGIIKNRGHLNDIEKEIETELSQR